MLQAQGSDLRRTSGDTTPGLTIAMVLLASVLAAIVSQAGLGMVPAVKVPDYQLQSALELPLILIFGACCGLVSASFAYSNQVGCAWSQSCCCGPVLIFAACCESGSFAHSNLAGCMRRSPMAMLHMLGCMHLTAFVAWKRTICFL